MGYKEVLNIAATGRWLCNFVLIYSILSSYNIDSSCLCEAHEFVLGWELPWNSTESPSGYHCLGQRSASAVYMAMDRVYIEGIIGNNTMEFIITDSKCDNSEALGQAIDLIIYQDVDAMLGPPCSGPCNIVSTLASFSELVMTSWFCPEVMDISNKTLHPYTSRLLDPIHKMTPLAVTIMQEFGWEYATIITQEDTIFQEIADRIEHDLKIAGMTISTHSYSELYRERVFEILTEVKETARIIFLIVGTVTVLEQDEQMFMLGAKQMGMTNGDFVFINFEIFTDRPETQYWAPLLPRHEDKTADLLVAYRAMLHVTYSLPWDDGFTEFMDEVIPRMADPPFYLNITEFEASVMAGYLYDAVLLISYALNKTYEMDLPNHNSYLVAENMRDIIFEGVTGTVIMDEEGDRRSIFVLQDVQSIEENKTVFKTVAYMNGINYTLVRMEGTFIDWPGKEIPKDRPRCGFHGEYCWAVGQIVAMAAGIVAAIVAIIFAILFIIRYRRETARRKQWLLHWDDIQLIPTFPGTSDGTGLQSRISKFRLNRNVSHPSAISSLPGLERGFRGESDFAVAIYKAQTVAVKRILMKNFHLTTFMKKELTKMRSITHDNLNRFIGICPPDSRNNEMLYYVTEYCPKGSLMDILENDDIKLDMTFKFSFLEDVARGMYYLHNSEIKSHGMLKSSLCLIDSRWICKIADFGLIAEDIDKTRAEEKEMEARFRRKLWTAPELLRLECPSKGSPKGDVYSYAIIMQEIITRQGPFPDWDGSPREIVRRVMQREEPPFRPEITPENENHLTLSLFSLMTQCWEERPEDRPDFHTIRQRLRNMNRGRKRGLMDNMVLMLEKYTENLETIVADRTAQLVEEKRKTDLLLYRMLPLTVAEQLKRGDSVVGEFFVSVTIYFSDIVGFTKLCAKHTPMEVIDILNDIYSWFDDVIQHFAVYKVETIGDAYMVVSGLPERNGNRHAGEIASMSLSILKGLQSFKVRHIDEYLQVRIGINTGSVAAGVVGSTMPRYCLFGDAVNTASRMETNGEPNKIHISTETKFILDELGGYYTKSRGTVAIKGKGDMTTYWLIGEDIDKHKINNNNTADAPEKKFSTETNPSSDISGDSVLSPATRAPQDGYMDIDDLLEVEEEFGSLTSASGFKKHQNKQKSESTSTARSSVQSGQVTPKDVKISGSLSPVKKTTSFSIPNGGNPKGGSNS
ncbi:atrial natriuretic peptide receptor 2-like [Saccoglossus kowalevskii]|uniref:Guanylate cyclase n=1 Tax=Saccoglossus kowalevskii TaxID=10224 RepID=A0ABM0GZM1_SACKO|nr:PREDICTED: atrial natriuretic peptide receptor 2-like [Saccoglossus kowalevskii]